MTKSRRIQRITGVLLVAGAAAPVERAWAASPHASATVKAKIYKGPVVTMPWGPVQAVIKVKKMKMTAANVIVTPETFRSQSIDSQAVPWLIQETLKAQNANIQLISGATLTSEAYLQSLWSAVHKAKKDKLLK